MKTVVLIISLILTLLISGCGKDNSVTNNDTINGIPKHLPLNLTMSDQNIYGEEGFVLYLKSDAEVPCHYYISKNMKVYLNTLKVELEGVWEEDIDCAAVVLPAGSLIDLTGIGVGQYQIELSNGQKSVFELIVTENYYEIRPFITNNLTFINTKLMR